MHSFGPLWKCINNETFGQSALGVWRDEFHGTINGHKPEELNLERDENDGDIS